MRKGSILRDTAANRRKNDDDDEDDDDEDDRADDEDEIVQMVMIDDKVVAPLVDADSDADDNVDWSKISSVRTNFRTEVKS